MLKQDVLDINGNKVEEIVLSDSVFGLVPNKSVMHLAVVCYLTSQRRGTKSALTRAEVSGGGAKPWKQKGTGRARQGSTRSPQWRHGGVVFAPKPREFVFSINKKVKRLAIKSAFSAKYLSKELLILNDLVLNEIKTKRMIEILALINAKPKSTLVLPRVDINVIKSARNIEKVSTVQIQNLNTYNILYAGDLILTKESLAKIEEMYA